jgi:hypothetical protein
MILSVDYDWTTHSCNCITQLYQQIHFPQFVQNLENNFTTEIVLFNHLFLDQAHS